MGLYPKSAWNWCQIRYDQKNQAWFGFQVSRFGVPSALPGRQVSRNAPLPRQRWMMHRRGRTAWGTWWLWTAQHGSRDTLGKHGWKFAAANKASICQICQAFMTYWCHGVTKCHGVMKAIWSYCILLHPIAASSDRCPRCLPFACTTRIPQTVPG